MNFCNTTITDSLITILLVKVFNKYTTDGSYRHMDQLLRRPKGNPKRAGWYYCQQDALLWATVFVKMQKQLKLCQNGHLQICKFLTADRSPVTSCTGDTSDHKTL